MIVVVSKCVHGGDHDLQFETEDYAAATENIMLAITASGYAGVWMDGMMKFEGNAERVRQLLHIPEDERPRTIIPFGKPMEIVTQKAKKPFEGKRTIITRAEQSYGRVPPTGLCRSFISVYVPGAGLPGARASAFPAPHESEICPDRAAYSAPAIDTHKAQCRWPWPFPPANTQWHWIPLP